MTARRIFEDELVFRPDSPRRLHESPADRAREPFRLRHERARQHTRGDEGTRHEAHLPLEIPACLAVLDVLAGVTPRLEATLEHRRAGDTDTGECSLSALGARPGSAALRASPSLVPLPYGA